MDWMTILDLILGNLVEVLGGAVAVVIIYVITTYVMPWIKEKWFYGIVKNLMAAAEAEFVNPESGELKKEWVFDQLDKMSIKYDKALTSKFIDGFVLELTAAGILNKGREDA